MMLKRQLLWEASVIGTVVLSGIVCAGRVDAQVVDPGRFQGALAMGSEHQDSIASVDSFSVAQAKERMVRRLRKLKASRSTGSIAGGLTIGQAPFMKPAANGLNGVLQGSARIALGGVPIRAELDAGTAVPMRGSPVRFRLSLDRNAMTLDNRVDETVALDRARRSIDSLRQRIVLMQGERLAVQHDQIPVEGNPFSVDTLAIPGEGPDPVLSVDSTGTDAQTIDSTAWMEATDSVRTFSRMRRLEDLARRIAQAEDQVDSLARVEQRLTALVNARKSAPHGLADKLASIHDIEFGECHSTSTAFLVKDLTVQGAHLDVRRSTVYADMLYGRSLDDSWRALQANGRLAEALQQASLFLPARDLNPRRLGMAVLGYGKPAEDHVQVGVLYGTRFMVPPGAPIPDDAPRLRNLVIELNAGVRILRHHYVYLVIAGSSISGSDGIVESASGQDPDHNHTFIDRAGRSIAATAGLRSEWNATHTRLDVDAKVMGPDFYSIGMGFQRPGSRAFSVGLSQRISEKFDLRIRGVAEYRDPLGGTQVLSIWRGQFNMGYRPTRAWSFTAQVQPVTARTSTADDTGSIQRNWVMGGGVNFRRRVRSSSIQFSARGDRYSIELPDTLAPVSWWISSSFTMQWEKGAAVAWTFAGPLGEVSTLSPAQLAMNASLPVGKRTLFDGHVVLPFTTIEMAGYGFATKRRLNEHVWLEGKMERYATGANYFPTAYGLDQGDRYYWLLKVGYDW